MRRRRRRRRPLPHSLWATGSSRWTGSAGRRSGPSRPRTDATGRSRSGRTARTGLGAGVGAGAGVGVGVEVGAGGRGPAFDGVAAPACVSTAAHPHQETRPSSAHAGRGKKPTHPTTLFFPLHASVPHVRRALLPRRTAVGRSVRPMLTRALRGAPRQVGDEELQKAAALARKNVPNRLGTLHVPNNSKRVYFFKGVGCGGAAAAAKRGPQRGVVRRRSDRRVCHLTRPLSAPAFRAQASALWRILRRRSFPKRSAGR